MTEDECKLIFENVLNYNGTRWLFFKTLSRAYFRNVDPVCTNATASSSNFRSTSASACAFADWAASSSSLALSSAEFAPAAALASAAAALASHLFAYL